MSDFRHIVFAKGFGTGAGTAEFRMVFPERPRSRLERHLARLRNWPTVLEGLYGRTPEDFRRQYAIVLNLREMVAIAVAPTTDHFARRSIVLVGIVAERGKFNRDSALALEALSHARNTVGRLSQLLPELTFEELVDFLQHERKAPPPDYDHRARPAIEAVIASGLNGVATPLLVGLGSDVVVGTEHEALTTERYGYQIPLRYDSRRNQLVSRLGNSLAPTDFWEPIKGEPREHVSMAELLHQIEQLERRLRTIEATVEKLRAQVSRRRDWLK